MRVTLGEVWVNDTILVLSQVKPMLVALRDEWDRCVDPEKRASDELRRITQDLNRLIKRHRLPAVDRNISLLNRVSNLPRRNELNVLTRDICRLMAGLRIKAMDPEVGAGNLGLEMWEYSQGFRDALENAGFSEAAGQVELTCLKAKGDLGPATCSESLMSEQRVSTPGPNIDNPNYHPGPGNVDVIWAASMALALLQILIQSINRRNRDEDR